MKFPRWIRLLIARLEAGSSGYLAATGWLGTRAEGFARDANGEPIPWFTYPAIQFLEERAKRSWRVLEFGSGMGTLWWSQRVSEVNAIEHDTHWADAIERQCAANVHRVPSFPADAYLRPSVNSGPYEIVIVDGLFRPECLAIAPSLLTPEGVIVLDDAHREEYVHAISTLRLAGFKSIEFHGPQPVSKHPGCTAIFYRNANVLGL